VTDGCGFDCRNGEMGLENAICGTGGPSAPTAALRMAAGAAANACTGMADPPADEDPPDTPSGSTDPPAAEDPMDASPDTADPPAATDPVDAP
jgi:hypothetical protein